MTSACLKLFILSYFVPKDLRIKNLNLVLTSPPPQQSMSLEKWQILSDTKDPCNSSVTYFFMKRISVFGNYVTPYTMSLCEIVPWVQCPIGKVCQLLY